MPIAELDVAREVQEAFLGRPISTPEDTVAFWSQAGYGYAIYSIETDFGRDSFTSSREVLSEPPRIKSLTQAKQLAWPDPAKFDATELNALAACLPTGMKIIPKLGGLFHFPSVLLGFEDLCVAMLSDPPLARYVCDQVGQIITGLVQRLVRNEAVGAIWLSSDMAFNSSLMISPGLLRQYIFPWIKEVSKLTHEADKPLIFHSDGNLTEVIPDLVDAGIDALHPIEPAAMDIHAVRRCYGSNLCLIGNVDVDLLIRGTPEQVSRQAKQLVTSFAGQGGFVLGSGNSIPAQVPLENYQALIAAAASATRPSAPHFATTTVGRSGKETPMRPSNTHKPQPDFESLKAAIMRRRHPELVSMAELQVDPEVMEAKLGRPVENLADYVSFWEMAGYDYSLLFVRGQPLPDHFYQMKVGGTRKNLAFDRDSAESCSSLVVSGGIKDEQSFEQYPWIGPEDVYYDEVDAIREHLPDGMKLIVNQGPLFSGIWRVMGMEAFSIACVENPGLVEAIAEKLGELCVNIAESCLQREWVGAYWLGDDIAYTTGLMASPNFLRKYVFPYYKRIGQLCRRCDKPLIWHSDGNHTAVLDDIIDCGVSAVHPVEPSSVDVFELKRQYGDRLTFIGGMDVDLMSRGTPEMVAETTRRLLEQLAPGGGYVAGAGNSIPKYVPPENYNAFLNTVHRFGTIYRQDMKHEYMETVQTRRKSSVGDRRSAQPGL